MSATNTGAASSGETGLTTSGLTNGGPDPNGGGDPSTGGPLTTDVVIDEQILVLDTSWPANLVLDHLKSNWEEWDRRLNLFVDRHHFSRYLHGTIPCPDAAAYPTAARNWRSNDRALRAFILERVSDLDYGMASKFVDAHDVYEALRKSHEELGLHAQFHVLREALNTRFNPSTPLTRTFDDLQKLCRRFTKMGNMNDDKWKSLLIMNALGDNCPGLQKVIGEMLENPNVTSEDVINRVLREEQVLLCREKQGPTNVSESATPAAVSNKKSRPICSNCKRTNHRTEFCISPGGQMAGKSIHEARAAQKVGNSNNPTRPCGNRGTATQGTANQTITVNGKCYELVSADNTAPANTETDGDFTGIATVDYDQEESISGLATADEHYVSLDWNLYTRTPDNVLPADTMADSTGWSPITRPEELPFILVSSATYHISPEASDFKFLKSIPRLSVTVLGGSAVYAVGVGDIELYIASGHTLRLTNVLYIPESRVRVVSVHAMNKSGNYITRFDSKGCQVTNKSNTVLVQGSLSPSKRLYVLSTETLFVQRQKQVAATISDEVPV